MNTVKAARVPAFFVLLAVPTFAFAHVPLEGVDSFINGVLHPAIIPAHVLLILAVGLFVGQKGISSQHKTALSFIFAVIFGLVGAWFAETGLPQYAVLGCSATISLLIVLNHNLNSLWMMLIAAIAGVVIGLDSPQALLEGRDKFASFFGTAVGVYFLTLYPAALADRFNEKDWHKVALRVAASWVAASSLLVLALSYATSLK